MNIDAQDLVNINNMRMQDLPGYVSNKIVSKLSKGTPSIDSIDSVDTTDDNVTIEV